MVASCEVKIVPARNKGLESAGKFETTSTKHKCVSHTISSLVHSPDQLAGTNHPFLHPSKRPSSVYEF